MRPDSRTDGVPRATVRLSTLPGRKPVEETWVGANEARDEKLKVKGLERRARESGYELRHSDHGYSLIAPDRTAVDGRRDLTLSAAATLLTKALKA